MKPTIIAARLRIRSAHGDSPLGILELRDGRVVADGGARWLMEDFIAALPTPSGPVRVSPLEGNHFLLACWVSLVGTYMWGELEDERGRAISREAGLAMVEAAALRTGKPVHTPAQLKNR